jgi:hypothetical protein
MGGQGVAKQEAYVKSMTPVPIYTFTGVYKLLHIHKVYLFQILLCDLDISYS